MKVVIDKEIELEKLNSMLANLTDDKDKQSVRFAINLISGFKERPTNDKQLTDTEGDYKYRQGYIEGCEDAKEMYKRPTGEWKHIGGDEWCCPECGHVITTEGCWEHPLSRGEYFCPHCGAKMKKGD